MSCASCVGRVERQLEKIDGVEASVNLPLNQAFVKVPLGFEDSLLVDAVSSAGYDAKIHGAEQASDELEDTEHSEPEIDDAQRATALNSRLSGTALLPVPLFCISLVTAFQWPHWGWVAMGLSLPVTVWGGSPFQRGGVKAARHGG